MRPISQHDAHRGDEVIDQQFSDPDWATVSTEVNVVLIAIEAEQTASVYPATIQYPATQYHLAGCIAIHHELVIVIGWRTAEDVEVAEVDQVFGR